MKYKFRLSYKEEDKLIPVDLNNIDFLGGLDKTDIKTIDAFTTHFEDYDEMIDYLVNNNLIPKNIDKLYVSFDVKQDGKTYEQLYAYNKTLFFKEDKDKLKYSYVYRYIRSRIEDGAFLERIIQHYERKYVNKNFASLQIFARIINDNGLWSLENYDRITFFDELDHFLDFIFKTKTKDSVSFNYKNIRDFLCFINGEIPIKVKGNIKFETVLPKTNKIKAMEDDYVEPENITLEEYEKFIKNLPIKTEYFEPYTDGNDYIVPQTKDEIEESYYASAKKLCFKRDNGEYE